MSPLEACRAAFPALEWTALNGGGYRGWVVVGEVPSVSLGQVMAGPSKGKWFACNKGGQFRKWYGNNEWVVNYQNDGEDICHYIDSTPGVKVKSNGRVINRDRYFQEGGTWSSVTSSLFSMRYSSSGFVFETKGPMCFARNPDDNKSLVAFCNSCWVKFCQSRWVALGCNSCNSG